MSKGDVIGRQWFNGKNGQAMVEFLVVAGMLMAAVAILMVFLTTFREYGTRVLDLVGSEYP
jgi:hypothetical protein